MERKDYYEIFISMLLIVSFSQGIFELFGSPLWVPKLIEELLVVIIFISVVLQNISNEKPLNVFGALSIGIVLAVGVLSGIINGINYMAIILFIREILVYYLFFVAILNINLPKASISRLMKLLIFLFIIQIPASWIKYLVIGIDETWIGTVTHQGGTYGFIIPLFAGAFLIPAFFYYRKWRYLIWLALFFLFGVINEKRATIFVLPVLIIFLYLHYYAIRKYTNAPSLIKSVKGLLSFRKIILLAMVFVAMVYLGGRLIPSLNPEFKVWGPFNLKYIYGYTVKYNFRDYRNYGTDLSKIWYDRDIKGDTNAQKGRFLIIEDSFKIILGNRWYIALFGFGGGSISDSYLSGNKKDIMFKKLGLRGATPFMTFILLQTGLIGFIFMTRYFLKFYLVIWKQMRLAVADDEKVMYLGILGAWFVVVFDSYLYSIAAMSLDILTPAFYLLTALCIKGDLSEEKGILSRGIRR